MHTIVKEFKLHKFISEKSTLPDHSAITCDLNISDSDTKRSKHRKNCFQLHSIPFDLMAIELRNSALIATVELIENSRKSPECIDEIYEKLCDIISNETLL